MKRSVLVVLEDGVVRRDALDYAAELARRIEGGVVLLMLEDYPPDGQGAPSEIRGLAEDMAGLGVEASAESRLGDKTSELLKFLASAPPFHTIVWGGDHDLLGNSRRKQREHWFTKVTMRLGCPAVSVNLKDPNGGQAGGIS